MKIYCIYTRYDYEGQNLVAVASSFQRVIEIYNTSLSSSSHCDQYLIEERNLDSDMVYKIWGMDNKSYPNGYKVLPLEGWENVWENKAVVYEKDLTSFLGV